MDMICFWRVSRLVQGKGVTEGFVCLSVCYFLGLENLVKGEGEGAKVSWCASYARVMWGLTEVISASREISELGIKRTLSE